MTGADHLYAAWRTRDSAAGAESVAPVPSQCLFSAGHSAYYGLGIAVA
jgi:hypothetical protein